MNSRLVEAVPTDEAAADGEERFMYISSPFKPDQEKAELIEPRWDLLHPIRQRRTTVPRRSTAV